MVYKQFPSIRGELQGGVLEGFDLIFKKFSVKFPDDFSDKNRQKKINVKHVKSHSAPLKGPYKPASCLLTKRNVSVIKFLRVPKKILGFPKKFLRFPKNFLGIPKKILGISKNFLRNS